MTTSPEPPRSIRAACQFGLAEVLTYDGISALARATGWWRQPRPASGDLEDMTLLDKAYWFHKSSFPIERPVHGSGLEALFAAQQPPTALPHGFEATAEVRLSAVGDLMDHAYLARSGATLYADVDDLVFDADLAMANFEGVAQAAYKRLDIGNLDVGPPLVIGPEALDILTRGPTRRYDFLAAASNHSLDFGADGVASTMTALRERGFAFHGINEDDADAERACIVERRGVRIGILAHTFGVNAYPAPPDRPRIVNHTKLNRGVGGMDFSVIQSQLWHCTDAGVDFVVAQLHWGLEFERYPRPEQRSVAHRLAEMGVDLVVGHHPHVLQPTEYYRTRRDPDRVVPIHYSLGNLTNPFMQPYMLRSGVARLELAKGTTRDGRTRTYVRRAQVEEVEQVADRRARTLRLRRLGVCR